MKVRIDSELCSGHGRCYSVAPSVYSPDEQGNATPADIDYAVPEGQEDKAGLGKRSCPEGAISIIES